MTSLFQNLERLKGELGELQLRWALVGGLAVGVRTQPRFTRDLDVAVNVRDDAGAERLVNQFLQLGYQISAVLEQSCTGRLATVRLLPPGQDRLLDLLFASCGIEPEITADATLLTVGSHLSAPVARVGHLLAMKTLARDDSRRPQDRLDLAALLEVADHAERDLWRQSLQAMAERGYHRNRDLISEMERTLAEFPTK